MGKTRILIVLMVCCMAGVSCSGSGTSNFVENSEVDQCVTDVGSDSLLAALELKSLMASPGTVSWRGDGTITDCWLVAINESQPEGSAEVWIEVEGEITDAFIQLNSAHEVPDPRSIIWQENLDESFITIAKQSETGVELGLAGRRIASAAEVQACESEEELVEILAKRNVLSGTIQLCTIGGADDEGNQIEPVSKAVTSLGKHDRPMDVSVRAVDGMDEIGWSQDFHPDYDQNGEVNVTDLTPIAILYGLAEVPEFGWLQKSHRRVDGDGNGEINLADITPLAIDYGKTFGGFRVERAAGTEIGPEGEWEEVATIHGLPKVNQFGTGVGAVSNPPYSRLQAENRSGWQYYRVILIGSDGAESEPSEAVMAPDLTPPDWSGGTTGPELELVIDTMERLNVVVTFTEGATDDRAGSEFVIRVTGGEGAPDNTVVFYELDSTNTWQLGVSSPFTFSKLRVLQSGDHYKQIPLDFRQGFEYFVQVGVKDDVGNYTLSPWTSFIAEGGTTDESLEHSGTSRINWSVEVSREGDIRYGWNVPFPAQRESAGIEMKLYYITVPAWDNSNYEKFEFFEGAQSVPFYGQEVMLENAYQNGERLVLAMETHYAGDEFTTWSDGYRYDFRTYNFPGAWYTPLDDTGIGNILDLFDGQRNIHMGDELNEARTNSNVGEYIVNFQGSSVNLEVVEMQPESPNGLSYGTDRLYQEVPGTNEWFFVYQPFLRTEIHNEIYWYQPGVGVSETLTTTIAFNWPYNPFDSDGLSIWKLADSETAHAIRSRPVELEDGTMGFEIWEAKRGVGIYMLEVVTPGVFNPDHRAHELFQVNGTWTIIHEEDNGMSNHSPFFVSYLNSDGSWTSSSSDEVPDAFNSAEWNDSDNSKVDWNGWTDFKPDWPISYVIIDGSKDTTGDGDRDSYYLGLWGGDISLGIKSFTLMWEHESGEILDSAYPEISGRISGGIHDYGGITIGTNRQPGRDIKDSLIIDPDGKILDIMDSSRTITRGESHKETYIDTNYRFRVMPNKVEISDDGQWLNLSSSENGRWCTGYWLDQN